MAVIGARANERAAAPPWSWRGELTLALVALRSPYPYLLALVAVLAVTLTYQAGRDVGVRIGGGYDEPYAQGFHEREANAATGERWRYATDRARVLLPGAGARDSTLLISAGPRPDGVLAPVQVVANGIALGQFTPQPTGGDYPFALPASDYSYGDLTIDLISAPQLVQGKGATPVPFGPRVTAVRVVAEGGGLVKPPLRPLASWLVVVPLAYLLARRLGLRTVPAVAVGLVLLTLGVAATAAQRLDLALFAPRLAFLLLLAYLLVVGSDLLVPRLFARGGVAIDEATWRRLQLIALLPLVLKLGGVLYPQLFVIDQPAQNQFFEKILLGRFMELYRPTEGSISSLPGQWGINAQLPYPPFFFVFGLPFYLWPLGKDLSINVWSVLLDCSRPLLIFFLARLLGATDRAASIAAFVMGLTASTFLLHSWGNYPTTASQWCALLFIVLLVTRFRDLRRPGVFAGLLVLLAITMVLYTVTAVFIGVFLLALLAGLRWHGGPDERRQIAPLAGLLVGASLIAFFAYYVQYVGPILTTTLPAFLDQWGQGEVVGGLPPVPFTTYAWNYGVRLFRYGVLISLLLAPFGAWLLARAGRDRLAGPLIAAWFAVFALFFLAGTRIDMVDKEVWFILPLLAICAGVACDELLRRWQPRRLSAAAVSLYLAHLTWGGITLWLVRIMVTRH